MKIFIIGGSGFLGSYLIPQLVAKKHEVTVLSRSPEKREEVEKKGAKVIIGNILNPDTFEKEMGDPDWIILMAMPVINFGKRIPGRLFRVLTNYATLYFHNTMKLAENHNSSLILTSGAGFQTTNNEVADEKWPTRRKGIAELGKYTDVLMNKELEKKNTRTIVMMPGQIYGNGGVFKSFIYRQTLRGRFRIVGKGDNYIPRVHVADCADAYVKAIEKKPYGEKFILADDKPVTTKEFHNYLADKLGVKRPKNFPLFLVRLGAGKRIADTVSMNAKVSNKKAKRTLGWQLKYPDYKKGIDATIKEIMAGSK
ncbi:MAG: NAD-dependent epimerase/dehydratase family protein [Bacteroidota bacterium]